MAERKPSSDLGRAAIDWNAAFLFYSGLPPERRSYAAAAAKFGVSIRTVERHGREGNWKKRAAELDRDAARIAGERIRDKRADALVDTEKLIEASMVTLANQLRSGDVNMKPSDLATLHKLRTTIWEQTDAVAAEQPEPAQHVDGSDPTERKRQVLRALEDAGVLRDLFASPKTDAADEAQRTS